MSSKAQNKVSHPDKVMQHIGDAPHLPHVDSKVTKASVQVERGADLHAGLPLEYVIGGQEFFDDVLDNAARLELTVMAMPVRPLPLAALREDLCRRLASRLGRVSRMTYPATSGRAVCASHQSPLADRSKPPGMAMPSTPQWTTLDNIKPAQYLSKSRQKPRLEQGCILHSPGHDGCPAQGDHKATAAGDVASGTTDSSAGPRDWEQLRGLAATFSGAASHGSLCCC